MWICTHKDHAYANYICLQNSGLHTHTHAIVFLSNSAGASVKTINKKTIMKKTEPEMSAEVSCDLPEDREEVNNTDA